MRLATRTLLWTVLPFAVLLASSFWAAQTLVLSAVRKDLRATVKETQTSVVEMRAKEEQRNSRVLKIVAENPALKAGVQLLLEHSRNADARNTVEDQLLEISAKLGFDFMLVSNADGVALAGVLRENNQPQALDLGAVQSAGQGYVTLANRTYRVASVPIDEGNENLGNLSMGEQFDLSGIPVSAVLIHNGKILASNLPGIRPQDIASSLQNCTAGMECDNIRLGGDTYVSLPMESGASGNEYVLRSLQNVDAALRPIQSILRGVFLFTGLGALAGAVLVSVLSSRSIVKPIMGVVAHLRKTGRRASFPNSPTRNSKAMASAFTKFATSPAASTAPPRPSGTPTQVCNGPMWSSSRPWPAPSMPATPTPPDTAAALANMPAPSRDSWGSDKRS